MAALDCAKPVIAAVNGAAVGWGMELALYADIRIASERAVFAELFIKRGLICDVGGLLGLPALVGPAKAAELLFTGDPIDAAEAARIGLVSEVVAHDDLIPRALALAGRIAANPPLALVAMKEGLRRAAHGDPREIGAWAIEVIYRLFDTEDHREGVRAFLEKRAGGVHGALGHSTVERIHASSFLLHRHPGRSAPARRAGPRTGYRWVASHGRNATSGPRIPALWAASRPGGRDDGGSGSI